MIKYQGKITSIGPLVNEFLDARILVLFGENAPEELREFSILHDGQHLIQNVEAGDWFCLNDQRYRILAIGEVANKNLGDLGHLILKFNGSVKPEMPGDVCLEAKPIPEIQEGMHFSIITK